MLCISALCTQTGEFLSFQSKIKLKKNCIRIQIFEFASPIRQSNYTIYARGSASASDYSTEAENNQSTFAVFLCIRMANLARILSSPRRITGE